MNPLDPPIDPVRTANAASLDSVLVKGVAWTAAVKWLTQGITWGTTVVVARLLLPSDYGIVGMAAIYINLFTLLSEFGIGTAIVTLQHLSESEIAQLNSLSILLGVLGAMLSAAAAVPLANFFHSPNLVLVVIVLSCGFIASGARTVPYSLLQKELRFKTLAVIEGAQALVQGLLTLALAFLGFGYWALALGILSFSISSAVLTLLWRRHSFQFPRSASIREALHYSRRILIGRLTWAAYNDSDFIVAGRVLGQASLGAYTLAWTLAHTPLEKLSTLINRVTPSVFAKIQKDPDALRRYLRNITGVTALAIFPVTIGLALIAPELVPLALGPAWRAAVLPLQLLALHAVIRSNVVLITPLLNIIGEERLVMWNSVAALFVLPVSFYIGSRWGTAGIAACWVIIYPVLQIPLFSRAFRGLQLSASAYLASLWPALSACAVMAASVMVLKLSMGQAWAPFPRLATEILTGALTYVATLLLFHRPYLVGIRKFVRKSRLPSEYAPST